MKTIIFDSINGKIKQVKSTAFYYNNTWLHIRKAKVYAGDKRDNWIITDNDSGCLFAWHKTKKEVFILMDILFESYSKDEIELLRVKGKSKNFDKIKNS